MVINIALEAICTNAAYVVTVNYLYPQGDPNQNLKCLLTITLKLRISDPMLVKPKCVWEAYNFLKNCKKTAENCKQTAEN